MMLEAQEDRGKEGAGGPEVGRGGCAGWMEISSFFWEELRRGEGVRCPHLCTSYLNTL